MAMVGEDWTAVVGLLKGVDIGQFFNGNEND